MAKKGVPKMIRELRTVLSLTQEQFAAKVGVTFTTAIAGVRIKIDF